MNLFSGLEKFGIKPEEKELDIYENLNKKELKQTVVKVKESKQRESIDETEFLYDKTIKCAVCEKSFAVKIVKNGRLKRMQPDFDLRPRFENIDTLKYDIYSCPHCGYSAMPKYFDHLTPGQISLVKTQITDNFIATGKKEPDKFTYDEVISRYKLSLYCSVVKRSSISEKAYTCLKLAWVCKAKSEEMIIETEADKATLEELQKTFEEFYKEAYEGLQKAVANESYPICGMDMFTMDYLLAAMACHFHEYTVASKLISNILMSKTADRRMKNKALDLKEVILEAMRSKIGQSVKTP
ncbi:MAG: DUF2225 domain-containing protein [Lachnospiraceae bacterium]